MAPPDSIKATAVSAGRPSTRPQLLAGKTSEGRYDYIALVPLDFRPPVRHARKSTPKLCVDDVHEPVLYGHDLDGALAFVFRTRAWRGPSIRVPRRPRPGDAGNTLRTRAKGSARRALALPRDWSNSGPSIRRPAMRGWEGGVRGRSTGPGPSSLLNARLSRRPGVCVAVRALRDRSLRLPMSAPPRMQGWPDRDRG